MLSKSEKQQLRQLMQTPQYRTFEAFAAQQIDIFKEEMRPRDSDNEWGAVQRALLNEGSMRGIQKLLQELFKAAQDES